MANRDIRRIINTKQDSLESQGNLSTGSMVDGQVSISKSNNEQLSIRKKKYGRIYKSYMSSNGNQIVDKKSYSKRKYKFIKQINNKKLSSVCFKPINKCRQSSTY